MYKFYLNNTLVTEPRNWSEMITSIKRDRVIKGMLVTQDISVEFSSEPGIDLSVETGYSFLKNLFDINYTGECSVLILHSNDNGSVFTEFYKGIIFLPDIDWNRMYKLAKVKIRDNSYDARLNNNKTIPVFPSSPTSKNNATITAAPLGYMTWFRVQDGTTIQNNTPSDAHVFCYRVKDVLSQMIQYLSDGQVTFSSSEFESGGEFENLLITTGRAFRKSVLSSYSSSDFVQKWPGLTLEELIKDITRIADFTFIIEGGANPIFRLERESYFTENGVVLELENVELLRERVELTMLYSSIKLGSGQVADHEFLTFVESSRLIGWNKEQYPLLYTSNIDNTLDLSLKYTTSSNVIEYIYENAIPNTDDSLDNELIYVTATEISTNVYAPTKTNWINSSSARFYNENLTNDKICSRFIGGVPSTIVSNISTVNTRFKANVRSQATSSDPVINQVIPATSNPVKFGNITLNTGAGYLGFPDFYFTASADAVYHFNQVLNLKLTYVDGGGFPNVFPAYTNIRLQLKFKKYDSSNVFISEYTSTYHDEFCIKGGTRQLVQSFSSSIAMSTGDRVRVELEGINIVAGALGYEFYSILENSYFECTATSLDGGSYTVFDPNNYPALRSEFEYELSDTDWKKILANPRGKIAFHRYGETKQYGRIETLNMNHSKGIAKFVLNAVKKEI